MKFNVFYYVLLCVFSSTFSMDENNQKDLWAPRIEQAMQEKLKFDIYYCRNSEQYKKDQELLRNVQKTEQYVLGKKRRLNRVIVGDFAEIITSIVDSKMNGPLDLNHIGSVPYAEEHRLKSKALKLKQDAIVLLDRVKFVQKSAFTRRYK